MQNDHYKGLYGLRVKVVHYYARVHFSYVLIAPFAQTLT